MTRQRRATRCLLGVSVVSVLLAADAQPAVAHGGALPAPHDLWSAWRWDPLVLIGLVVGAWVYARGTDALWRRAGVGRGIRRWQAAAFGAGLLALAVALVSPLAGAADALFSAHMAQHLLLILVAAPLLVLGAPQIPCFWALPPAWRRALVTGPARPPALAIGRALSAPIVAWFLHLAAVWLWHLPQLYEPALTYESLHALEHVSFLATALLFWWVVIAPAGRRRVGHGAAIVVVLATALPTGLLGALMTLAPSAWYPAYATTTTPWGLTPLEDQQLGGLLMWLPPGVLYVVVVVAIFSAWLRDVERRVSRREAEGRAVRPFAAGRTEP